MTSRLFSRESDTQALVRGLSAIDALSVRLSCTHRELRSLLASADLPSEGEDHLTAALRDIGRALEEMADCSDALEQATGGPSEELSAVTAPSEHHYPELVGIERPEPDPEELPGAEKALTALARRYRIGLVTGRDRYTALLCTLPWVGPVREEFAGPRLTALRAALESAEEELRLFAAGGAVVIDLTSGAETSAESDTQPVTAEVG